MALAVIPLIALRSSIYEETAFLIESDRIKGKDRVKSMLTLLIPMVVLGILFVFFGDSALSFLNF